MYSLNYTSLPQHCMSLSNMSNTFKYVSQSLSCFESKRDFQTFNGIRLSMFLCTVCGWMCSTTAKTAIKVCCVFPAVHTQGCQSSDELQAPHINNARIYMLPLCCMLRLGWIAHLLYLWMQWGWPEMCSDVCDLGRLYFSWTMTFKVFSFGGFSPMSLQDFYMWLASMSPGGLVKPFCFHLTYFCLLPLFNVHWPWKRRSFHVVKHRWHSWFCEEICPTARGWHTKAEQKDWLEKESHTKNVLFLWQNNNFFTLITDHKHIKNFFFFIFIGNGGDWSHITTIVLSPIARALTKWQKDWSTLQFILDKNPIQ